ncbi:MAG: hypothetical protein QOE36_1964, partial [Gaiellaceae bacterium]|nr:hypothetical protein [Gaiellaceae bacterium]
MTALCPSGHTSGTTDYCDQCGAPIASALAPQATEVLPALEEADTSASAIPEPCPACGAARSGDDRFCEGCGHDFLAPPGAIAAWEAVVCADRAHFDRVSPGGLTFPADRAEQRFPLDVAAATVGRTRGGSGEPALEIDLAGPLEDPGVSRQHAVLERQADGHYAVRDLGS